MAARRTATTETAEDHADAVGSGPLLVALTAPGGDFELVEQDVDGVPMRVYVRGPHTLREMVLATAAFGDRPYSIYQDERCSYAEHLRIVLGLAARWRMEYGLVKGDRVAIAMRNYPEWSPVFWAAQVAGLVAVPLNAWWSRSELTWAVGDCGAGLVVADEERAELIAGETAVPVITARGRHGSPSSDWVELVAALDPAAGAPDVEVAPEDVSSIFYTSGTTGRPKGAVHSHRNHVTNALNTLAAARAVAEDLGQGAASPDQAAQQQSAQQQSAQQPGTLLSYPLFHIAGLNSLYGTVLIGGRIATQYRWDAEEARRLVREEKLTTAAGVPTTMRELAEAAIAHPDELATLSRIGMGGAPIPPELVGRIGGELGPRTWATSGYGLTETTSAVCANSGRDYARHPDSVGRPVPGADLRIVDPETLTDVAAGDVGELWFRGPNVVRGYWRNPEATAAAFVDGWFRTGDLGYVRAGWVYVVDRLKDMIVRGGENVYCVQVEDALHEIPWVREAAVYGVPHPSLGEEVAAAVRTDPDAPRDVDHVRAWVTRRVAEFAAPAHVVWFDGPLPRTATGKVLKRQLRDQR